MALNFPNNPTSGQTHTGVNNIVYRYDGEKWITQGSANVAGSDPTFSTVTTTGGASFASGAFEIRSTGETVIDRTSGSSGCLSVRLNGTENGRLNADGSATFAGDVNVSAQVKSTIDGVRANFYAAKPATGTSSYLYCEKDGSLKAKIDHDGAAWLASNTMVGGTPPSAGVPAVPNISLNADGSATFAGAVKSPSWDVNQDQAGFFINSGALFSHKPTGDPSSSALAVYYGSGHNQTASIHADGSAKFAGDIGCGPLITSGGVGARMNANGAFALRNDSTTTPVFQVFKGGTTASDRNILFNNDGSATFAGNMRVDGGTTTVPALLLWANDNAGKGLEIRNAGNAVNATIDVDGSATFAGNITAGNVSDIKFKENITDANPQLADVTALGSSLKNWDWKEEAPLNDELKSKRFLGLIAQEAEAICPGVTYEVGEGEDSYKAINHDILVMKLLGAVAELKAEVETLKGN